MWVPENILSPGANSCCGIQKIPCILRIPKAHCRVDKSPSLLHPCLESDESSTRLFLEIHFNFNHVYAFVFQVGSSFEAFWPKFPYVFLISARFATSLAHLILHNIIVLNSRGWITIYVVPPSSYFASVRSEYPQKFALNIFNLCRF
jgi:Gpi18-like mannosyltransferase